MRFGFCLIRGLFALGMTTLALSFSVFAQAPDAGAIAAAQEVPDAPQPQIALPTVESSSQDQSSQQQTPSPTPAQTPAPQGSSSAQQSPPSGQEKSQHDKAEQQIKEQEQQRVLGIVPAFNISYRADAVPLTAAQKMKLAFHSSVDPVTFAAAVLVAGYHEALDDDTGFGWGAEGFGKRAGAAYLDAFDGTMIGNGILPAVLHQDPRYFRLGHGTATHRVLYALFTNVACKGDKSRKWQPNISNVGGNIISGAISNLYYPAQNSGWGETITNGLTVTAEGGFGSLFQEFWPDLSRRFLHKDPTQGRDAEVRALDAKEKEERKKQKEMEQEKKDQKQSPPQTPDQSQKPQ
ncbi:MAG: hypothetical protein ABSG51_05975 [Terracidiphilus sp.]|jgi:hypothetical protein